MKAEFHRLAPSAAKMRISRKSPNKREPTVERLTTAMFLKFWSICLLGSGKFITYIDTSNYVAKNFGNCIFSALSYWSIGYFRQKSYQFKLII
jgi:hypothetical protein